MSETKKGGFIKRLFGGKKEGCCGVQIKEIKDEDWEKNGRDNPSGCCIPKNNEE